ncbi:MAG: ORF6N domain-containing protein [Syntrophaceae bacterium]
MKKYPTKLTEGFIEKRIFLIRGNKVILSTDLAELYGVKPKVLNQAVKRNIERFPSDFMFQLTNQEFANLKSQTVTSSWGGLRRAMPYAFTEHGAIMVASVLNTPRAIEISVYVVRAFVRLREYFASHKELARKLTELEKKIETHDEAIQSLIDAIRQLMEPPKTKRRRIGFLSENRKE